MKIVFFISNLRVGGTERRMLSLINEMIKKENYEITLLLLSNEIQFDAVDKLKINVKSLGLSKSSKPKALIQTYKILKNLKPDIVHCWDGNTGFYVALIRILIRFKFINSQIASAPEKISKFSIIWYMTRVSLYLSNLVISNSKAGLKAYKAPRNKSIHIYNGFDFSRLTRLKSAESIRHYLNIKQKFVVAMVANFTVYKDQEVLIRAGLSVLKERTDVAFLFAGDGPTFEHCKNLTAGYEKNFYFSGHQKEVESIIHCIDIGVLCSESEGISNTIMEYMASSKPVIATKNQGNKELVIDAVTGFLVEKEDVDALKRHIVKLLEDEKLRIRLGNAGRERIDKHFNINEMVDKYLIHYN